MLQSIAAALLIELSFASHFTEGSAGPLLLPWVIISGTESTS